MKRLLLVLGASLFTLLALEGLLRVAPGAVGFDETAYAKLCAYARGENPGIYAASPHTIYRVKPQPGVNARGFSDREWDVARRARVPRIACLGASTTQDGIGPDRPSYPNQLARVLRERLGSEVETLNFGVDGWTTAETLTNYFLNVVDFAPDVVVVQHALNDVWPRLWPDYRSDYSHYRAPYRDIEFGSVEGRLFRASRLWAWLDMRGRGPADLTSRNTQPIANRREVLESAALTPDTLVGYRRNLRSLIEHATARGCAVLLVTIKTNPRGAEHIMKNRPVLVGKLVEGTEQHNEVLRELAAETPALLVDVDAMWEADGFEETHLPNYTDGFVHVNAAGNLAKARAIADVIVAERLLERE